MGDIRSTSDALKVDMESLKSNLQTHTAGTLADLIGRMHNLLPSLETHFNVQGRDRGGATLSMQHSPSQATTGVNAALRTLKTLIEDPKSLNPIVKMLEDMVGALETLRNHI